jgi:hypothetical protein
LVLCIFTGCATGVSGLKAQDGDLVEGQRLVLRAEVEGGEAPFTYIWFKDYVPVAGGTDAELVFPTLQVSDSGSYTVTVSNAGGYATSNADVVRVKPGSAPGRLSNLSVITSSEGPVIVGFTVGGAGASGSAPLLARAAGPALSGLGIAGSMRDPILSVFAGGMLVASNDDWAGDAQVMVATAAVGAFPFAVASKDSAVALSLRPAPYTAEVIDGNHVRGTTAVELYDATLPGTHDTPRLINLSAQGNAGAGDGTLIAGFTIAGEGSVKVLVRAVGPSLAQFAVNGALENPHLALYRSSTLISANDDWTSDDAAAILEAQRAAGAFEFLPKSHDAAILTRLGPGSYTAQISSPTGTGIALIEIYEVP